MKYKKNTHCGKSYEIKLITITLLSVLRDNINMVLTHSIFSEMLRNISQRLNPFIRKYTLHFTCQRLCIFVMPLCRVTLKPRRCTANRFPSDITWTLNPEPHCNSSSMTRWHDRQLNLGAASTRSSHQSRQMRVDSSDCTVRVLPPASFLEKGRACPCTCTPLCALLHLVNREIIVLHTRAGLSNNRTFRTFSRSFKKPWRAQSMNLVAL